MNILNNIYPEYLILTVATANEIVFQNPIVFKFLLDVLGYH